MVNSHKKQSYLAIPKIPQIWGNSNGVLEKKLHLRQLILVKHPQLGTQTSSLLVAHRGHRSALPFQPGGVGVDQAYFIILQYTSKAVDIQKKSTLFGSIWTNPITRSY